MKTPRTSKGFTLIEIMIVVSIIALLAIIATPNFIQARNRSRSSSCINNLRVIDSSKEQYALESNAAAGSGVTSTDISPYLRNGAMPQCLDAGVYTIQPIGTLPVCSLSGVAAGATPRSHRLD